MEVIKRKCTQLLFKIYEKKYRKQFDEAGIIIQPCSEGYGFFAHFINICGEIKWGMEKGKKPYVDMATFPNGINRPDEVGKVNAWELFFEQPFSYTEEEFQELMKYRDAPKYWHIGNQKYAFQDGKRKKIVYLIRTHMGGAQRPSDAMDFLTNDCAIAYWRAFLKKYIRPSAALNEYIKEIKESVFPKEQSKILGVLLRGTDFTDNRPWNHPISPTVQEAIPKIREVYKNGKYDYVFLVTEDQRIVEQMTEEFGQILLVIPQHRVGDISGQYLREVYNKTKELDLRKHAYNYVSAIMLLSQCDGIMACRTSGAVTAYLFGDEFQDIYFWNLGRYITDEYPEIV